MVGTGQQFLFGRVEREALGLLDRCLFNHFFHRANSDGLTGKLRSCEQDSARAACGKRGGDRGRDRRSNLTKGQADFVKKPVYGWFFKEFLERLCRADNILYAALVALSAVKEDVHLVRVAHRAFKPSAGVVEVNTHLNDAGLEATVQGFQRVHGRNLFALHEVGLRHACVTDVNHPRAV